MLEHNGAVPKIDATARVAPNAVICGDITVGANTSIGFGAVLTAESGPIVIGANCVIMDTAVIRGTRRNPVAIGDNVLVGPRAYLSGCSIEDNAFLATGATIFNGARIGARSEVRVNGIVHLKTVLPPDTVVPLNWIAVGDPAEILPPDRHDRIWSIQKPLDFPQTVFGVERPGPGETVMPEVMPRYARALAGHKNDKAV
ncbi:MAG: gamma carbonic anhydrase family protein [Rhodospirillales bacterium]|nr:gamma carbonic anhydrase family protein [Rhodospirillales bacterium]MDH3967245.1 gamma carbonic anhydrase family protein [Rhodospirillales bacterium]